MSQVRYVCCMRCQQERVLNQSPLEFYKVLAQTDKPIVFECLNGHKNLVYFQINRAEALLEQGLESFINHNYRDSIANFSSGLERLYELTIFVILRESGLSEELICLCRQFLKRRSERELGAFVVLYACRFGHSPLGNQKDFESRVRVRNDLVHNGDLPGKEKARKFGEFALDVFHRIMKDLCEEIGPFEVMNASMEFQRTVMSKLSSEEQSICPTFVGDSIFNMTVQSVEEVENEKRLQRYAELNPEIYANSACKANESQSRLWVDDSGSLKLLESDEYEKRCSKRLYCGQRTFDQYCNAIKERAKMYQGLYVIDRLE